MCLYVFTCFYVYYFEDDQVKVRDVPMNRLMEIPVAIVVSPLQDDGSVSHFPELASPWNDWPAVDRNDRITAFCISWLVWTSLFRISAFGALPTNHCSRLAKFFGRPDVSGTGLLQSFVTWTRDAWVDQTKSVTAQAGHLPLSSFAEAKMCSIQGLWLEPRKKGCELAVPTSNDLPVQDIKVVFQFYLMDLHETYKKTSWGVLVVLLWSLSLSPGLCEVRRFAGMEPNSEAGTAFRDERSLDASPEASDRRW